ncbi:MAG TPA: FAD-dependent oxidoreductase [Syntrophomonas sp.]|nr:FAD-dependent oxidoreductase [Syntrophomonas sp.]
MPHYDVIIIGAGPAGIFTALELSRRSGLKVLLLEKGKKVQQRHCLIGAGFESCQSCAVCSIMSGWGGAGAFSDGKLTLTSDFGGWLADYIGRTRLEALITYVDDLYVKHGAPPRVFGQDDARSREIAMNVAAAGLKLVPARIRHMGTENTKTVLQAMYQYLEPRVDIRTGLAVEKILTEQGRVIGIATSEETFYSRFVVVAPGREGAHWFFQEAQNLNITMLNNQVDIGVRVEVPAVVMKEVTAAVWEPKMLFNTKTFDDMVRTFCVNPNGYVVMENTNGIITVNGHSYANSQSSNTNFALLMSQEFTEPFNKPILYGRCIASLANMLSGSIIVQRYGDLKRGRRSTPERLARSLVTPTLKGAVPGDLSLVLPHRYLIGIMECLEALDKAFPGAASDHTLLYGVEAKFYSDRPQLDKQLRTPIEGLWAIGDGAGVTRGLIQASVSGVVAAQAIMEQCG